MKFSTKVLAHRLRSKRYYQRHRKRILAKHKAQNEVIRARAHKARGLPVPTRRRPKACELCGAKQKALLALDHDHAAKKFRGWLCNKCNIGLGHFGDTIAGIKRALRYLERTA